MWNDSSETENLRISALNSFKMGVIEGGTELIDLSMINPDLAPARYIQDQLVQACLKGSNHRYSVSRGIRKLREAFSYKYNAHGIKIDPEAEICVTQGSKDGIFSLLQVLASQGKRRALITRPWYSAHLGALRLSGFEVGDLEWTGEQARFVEQIAQTLKTEKYDLLLLNFPNNPTGQTLCLSSLLKIKELCKQTNTLLVNDFAYGEMVFDGDYVSALNAGDLDGVLEVTTMSKAYSVPGWRIGAICGDKKLVKAVAEYKSVVDYGVFLPLQIAAAFVLCAKDDLVKPLVSTYRKRANILAEGLKALNWNVTQPEAGATLWAAIPEKLKTSEGNKIYSTDEISTYILKELGIATLSGSVFGKEGYLRFALVSSEEKLREVLNRLKTAEYR